jgi:hypothetical protein
MVKHGCGGDAWVWGDAQVYGNARVYGEARVTKIVKNIIGYKWDITITDKHVQVGCKQFTFSVLKKLKYSDVKKECTLKEFKLYKEIILNLIKLYLGGGG